MHPGEMDALKKGMADHNKKFHSIAPYHAEVWNVFVGPHEGRWLWGMGPCTFTDLDNEPAGQEAHDKDWMANVESHCVKVSEEEYWKLNDKYSYTPEGYNLGKAVWTFFDIKPFEMYRFHAILEKVAKVYREKKYPNPFNVFENQFDSNNGRDIMLEWGFNSWSYFDKDNSFKKDYEELNGEGSWNQLLNELRDIVNNSYDEVAEYMKNLSGGE